MMSNTNLRTRGALASALVLAASPLVTAARAAAPAPSATVRSAAVNTTYRISADDVLEINVQDMPGLTQTITVLPDGTITLQKLGRIKVANLTTPVLEKMLSTRYNKFYVNPQVSVLVRQRQQKTVSVLGAVRAGGKHGIRENARVFDALADSGGLPSDRLEFYSAELIRGNAVMPVDLQKVYAGDAKANFALKPDDIIYVREMDQAQTTVQVVGEVGKPGQVLFPRDGSLTTVLTAAGGPTQFALLSAAHIERKNGATVPVDLRGYVTTGEVPAGATLQPGDRLVIPQNKKFYTVYNFSGRAGKIVYPEDHKVTVAGALADAGGQTEGVELKKVSLIRPSATSTQPAIYELNIKSVIQEGKLQNDMTVLPGDIIYLPPSGRPKGIRPGEALGIIGAIPTLSYFFKGRY